MQNRNPSRRARPSFSQYPKIRKAKYFLYPNTDFSPAAGTWTNVTSTKHVAAVHTSKLHGDATLPGFYLQEYEISTFKNEMKFSGEERRSNQITNFSRQNRDENMSKLQAV